MKRIATLLVVFVASLGQAQKLASQDDVLRAAGTVVAVRKEAKNPDRFVLVAVGVKQNKKGDPDICVAYRATNSFGGTVPEEVWFKALGGLRYGQMIGPCAGVQDVTDAVERALHEAGITIQVERLK